MLFKRYHLLILRDGRTTRSISMRPIVPLVFFCAMILLSSTMIHFWRHSRGGETMDTRLALAQAEQQEQTHQLLTLSSQVRNIQDELERIRDFDTRLHVMFSDEEPLQDMPLAVASGGSHEFSRTDLFPLRPQALTRVLRQCQEDLDVQMHLEEVRQQQLMLAIRSQVTRLHLMPSIWPVSGIITSGFGYRRDPFTNASSFHPALDISAPKGTPVYAPASGRVIYADWDGAYGLCVHVRHTPEITTRYAHLTEINVRLAQTLDRGDIVGYVGSTGRATGAHLHYEVRINNEPVNPRNYILN